MFFGFGSTPFRIRHLNPSTILRVIVSLIGRPFPVMPNVACASKGEPPIWRHRLKKSSGVSDEASMYLCIIMGNCSVYACNAPARYDILIVGASVNAPWASKQTVCCVWLDAATLGSGRLLVSTLRLGEEGLSRVVVNDPMENEDL